MKTAPIVLFVYNRINSLQLTIKHLKDNFLSNESDLIIYSDGPKRDEDIEKVKIVREFLKTINGFKSITIYERSINKGLADSIIDGVTEIVNKYGKIIVLEDDLITSPYFLKYMNDALNIYENEERVISIHGFIHNVKKKLPETFFLKGADCWGWATWKRGWDIFEKDGSKLLKELEEKKLTYEFDFRGGYPYTEMLRHQVQGKVNSWAIRWYASAFLKDKFTLYPGKSLVAHLGIEEGTHSNDGYNLGNISSEPINIKEIEIKEDLKTKKIIIKYLYKERDKNLTFIQRIKNILKNLLKI